MSLEKDFVPYEESLELKELGFDEECIGFYKDSKDNVKAVDQHWGNYISGICKKLGYRIDDLILAPTFSQAFRFFREKYNLKGGIEYIGGLTPETTWWDIYIVGHFNTDASKMTMKYQPYEEAELACLRMLIKIAKNEIQVNK